MSCFSLSRKASFISMMLLTSSFFLVEIIVGYITNSMALVADSFHMLSDVVSLLVGFLALRYSKRGRKTGRYTFGYARAEVLGALVNAVFLVALCFSILVESMKRFIITEQIDNPHLVLYVGIAGLVVNIIGLFLFHQHGHGHSHGGGGHGHSHGGGVVKDHHSVDESDSESETEFHDGLTDEICTEKKNLQLRNDKIEKGSQLMLDENEKNAHAVHSDDGPNRRLLSLSEKKKSKKMHNATQLNMRGVYLHVLGDALGSVIVVISALIIIFVKDSEWTLYVDPTMSVLMVMIILKTSIPLLKESSMILMQTVPTHLKIQEIKDKLVDQVSGVLSIHEFHIWQLAGNRIIASAHVRCHSLADYMAIANQLKEFFHNEGIHSTTIQPEFEDDPMTPVSEVACMLECGPEKNCEENRCCGPQPLTPGQNGSSKRCIVKKQSIEDDDDVNCDEAIV